MMRGMAAHRNIDVMDDDGYLQMPGARDHHYRWWQNLSPEKIENALKMSPYIKEVVAMAA